jgi:hypothetical protein
VQNSQQATADENYPSMSTTTHYHPRGLDIDLSELPSRLYDEIVSLRGQVDHNGPPIFTCLGNGTAMLVYRHESGRYYLRHFPGESCGHSHVLSTISDEHRRQAEYAVRAARDNGLEADFEVSTGGGTRVDVGVTGDTQVGFEIQRSQLTRARAKSRAARSFNAGWPTAWVSDRETEPDWAFHVPTARLTVREMWSALPPPNTANVIIRRFSRERDKNSATGWKYVHEPTAVTLDELSYLMPTREIVPVQTPGVVFLAHRGAAEIIDSCLGHGASEWKPTHATPATKEAAQTISRQCWHESPDDYAVKETVSVSDYTATTAAPVATEGGEHLLPGEIACLYCGHGINPVFGLSVHYDCQEKMRN